MITLPNHPTYTPPMRGFFLRGSAPKFGGPANPTLTDTGETLIKASGQTRFSLSDFELANASGAALLFESSVSMDMGAFVSEFDIHDSYIGIRTQNSGEYMSVGRGTVHHCTFGLHCTSGNNKFVGTSFLHNKYGVFVYAGENHAHGVIDGVTANHNETNVICWDITIGQVFNGGCFFGGYDGGNGKMDFQRSKGILFNGSHIGASDISIDSTSEVSFRGVLWQGSVNLTVAGVLDAKNCVKAPGSILTMNGVPWAGNN